jgi:O-antigen/teichoic acid export membrane protein
MATAAHEDDARHAARSGAAQVVTVLAQALIATTQVVFARLYGASVYGGYQAALAIVEVAARGGAGGADKAMLRYVAASRAAGDPEGVRRAIGTGLRLCIGLAGSAALVLALAAAPLGRALDQPELALALRALLPVTVMTGVLQIFMQASLAARITRANFWVRGLFEPAVLLAAGVTAWALGGGLGGLALAHTVAATSTVAVAAIVVRRVLRPGEREALLAAPRLPGFARFALPMGAAEVLLAVLQRADVIIVTVLRGTEGAAVYAAAEYLTRVVTNIRYAFDSIVAGMMSETLHLGERDRLVYNLRLYTRWVVTLAAPLAVTVLVLRHELLRGLYGAGFVSGTGAVAILAVSHLINASCGLVGWVLVAGGRSRLVLINSAAGVLVNVTLGIVLTARLGVVGTALAVLASVVVIQGAGLIEAARYEGVRPFSAAVFKPLAAAALTLAVQAVVHRALAPGWPAALGTMGSGAVVYGVMLVAMGLPAEERRIAARVLRRR